MNATMDKIAAGLEQAFAMRGFATPSVEDLRDAAGVSLRTLYKYTPSRVTMVRAALEHRHQRYLAHLFEDVPQAGGDAMTTLIDRIALWMTKEASHGCLFHAAVAAAPDDQELRALLDRHKTEVATRTAAAVGLAGQEADIGLILEGLTQSWSLQGEAAADSAKRLMAMLAADPD